MQSEFAMYLRNAPLVACAAISLLAFAAGPCRSAETERTPAETEAAVAKAEDAAEETRGEEAMLAAEKTVSGKLTLGLVVQDRPDIVGLVRTEKGPVVPLKLSADGLLEALKPYNSKPVVLQGKFRNQGKYFIVSAVIPPPATTVEFTKEGGL